MKEDKIKTFVEVFICNHKRDNDEDCFSKGAKELTDNLKKWTKKNHPGEIKVYRSGCLSKCSEGIAIACYPKKEIILEVSVNDEKNIMEDLEETLRKIKEE